MADINIGIEHGEKLKLRPPITPITSGEANETLKLDPRAGSGTLPDKNDYLLPPGQALLQEADGQFVFRRQGAGVHCAAPNLCLTIACRAAGPCVQPHRPHRAVFPLLISTVKCSQGT